MQTYYQADNIFIDRQLLINALDYVCNEVREGARKVNLKKQREMVFEKDLFSG